MDWRAAPTLRRHLGSGDGSDATATHHLSEIAGSGSMEPAEECAGSAPTNVYERMMDGPYRAIEHKSRPRCYGTPPIFYASNCLALICCLGGLAFMLTNLRLVAGAMKVNLAHRHLPYGDFCRASNHPIIET